MSDGQSMNILKNNLRKLQAFRHQRKEAINMEESTSPVPQPNTPETYSFFDALREVLNGRRITRLDWGTDEVYGDLKEGTLRIYRDNVSYQWTVSEGDMTALDWIILPEGN
jgi:hypothetical protein